jgi:hypothetical protein
MKVKLLVEIELDVFCVGGNAEAPLRKAIAQGPDESTLRFSTEGRYFGYEAYLEKWEVKRVEIER